MTTIARVSNRSARDFIAKRLPFQGSNFRGETITPDQWVNTGRIHDDATYRRLVADQGRIDYCVFSYATPIAWHTPDGWYVAEEKHSVTTTRHQSHVRNAL